MTGNNCFISQFSVFIHFPVNKMVLSQCPGYKYALSQFPVYLQTTVNDRELSYRPIHGCWYGQAQYGVCRNCSQECSCNCYSYMYFEVLFLRIQVDNADQGPHKLLVHKSPRARPTVMIFGSISPWYAAHAIIKCQN